MGQGQPLASDDERPELDDRQILLRLVDQVARMADQLEALTRFRSGSDGAAGVELSDLPPAYDKDAGALRLVRAAAPPLPDPRLVRKIIRNRQLRARFFDGELFADPVWDILLDLLAARAEHQRVSVTSVCIASGVPPTTALRWIGTMADAGLIERVSDDADRRRSFIVLTDKAASGLARYFREVSPGRSDTV